MTVFRSLPIFRLDPEITIGAFARGEDACRLAYAIVAVRGHAEEAARALGDPASPARRAAALRLLEAMPARQQELILAAYRKSKRSEVAG